MSMARDAESFRIALIDAATMLGLTTAVADDGTITGHKEAIRSKWWFGGRKVVYRMSCRLSQLERTVHFREAEIETSWGLPPPQLTVQTETVSGWKRSGSRTDVAPGGGGSIDLAQVRSAIEAATVEAGWQFHLEGGRLP